MTANFGIPSAETILRYEKLGIVGILLLVLAVGLVVALKVASVALRVVNELSERVLAQLRQQTASLHGLEAGITVMVDSQERLHHRLDTLFSSGRDREIRPPDDRPEERNAKPQS